MRGTSSTHGLCNFHLGFCLLQGLRLARLSAGAGSVSRRGCQQVHLKEVCVRNTHVGVREGSQKSGSFAFIRSACSISIFFNAACSASSARVETVDEENMKGVDSVGILRFVPVSAVV